MEPDIRAVRDIRTNVIDPVVGDHGGRIFKTTGDGVLVEFPSVVNAVACAADIQRAMLARGDQSFQLRIGVNLGDVVIDADDVFG